MEVVAVTCRFRSPRVCSTSTLSHKETSTGRPAIAMVQQQLQYARTTVLAQSVFFMSKRSTRLSWPAAKAASASSGVPLPPLDLTEDNVRLALADARVELGQLFDVSAGITGEAELAELDGPFVKISLKGRFWHRRSTVLARIGNYLKQRIPEILEVEIEDEKQLDDSPENF